VSFPILLFWVALHRFVAFWRRMGLTTTYAILVAGMVGGGVVLFSLRKPLLAVEFGTAPVLWAPAALAYATAVALEVRARHLRLATFAGVSELRGDRAPASLLTDGIYGRVRHPRYVASMLGYLASAFLANYLFLYAAAPVYLLVLHTVVLLEERELEERFGEAYRGYADRVPRYLPRFGV